MNEAFVEVAKSWIGTPYLHQAASKGVGCDCLGLIRGVWREVCGAEPEAVPAYTADWSEPQGEERLFFAASRHLRHVESGPLVVGQVLLFRMRTGAVAKHLGLVSSITPHWQFIHAYTGHGVVESPLSEPWRRRIVARFVGLEG